MFSNVAYAGSDLLIGLTILTSASIRINKAILVLAELGFILLPNID
jgi:hypothetical protein